MRIIRFLPLKKRYNWSSTKRKKKQQISSFNLRQQFTYWRNMIYKIRFASLLWWQCSCNVALHHTYCMFRFLGTWSLRHLVHVCFCNTKQIFLSFLFLCSSNISKIMLELQAIEIGKRTLRSKALSVLMVHTYSVQYAVFFYFHLWGLIIKMKWIQYSCLVTKFDGLNVTIPIISWKHDNIWRWNMII